MTKYNYKLAKYLLTYNYQLLMTDDGYDEDMKITRAR